MGNVLCVLGGAFICLVVVGILFYRGHKKIKF
jgi:hypothetical protein